MRTHFSSRNGTLPIFIVICLCLLLTGTCLILDSRPMSVLAAGGAGQLAAEPTRSYLLPLISLQGCSPTYSEIEPNNSASQAQNICYDQAVKGRPLSGSFVAGDLDVYKIYFYSTGYIAIHLLTQSSAIGSTTLALYGSKGGYPIIYDSTYPYTLYYYVNSPDYYYITAATSVASPATYELAVFFWPQ